MLGGIGAAIGSVFGGGQIGFEAGVLVAGILFPPHNKAGHPAQDIQVTGSGYGSTIPQVYGRFRISGDIIDSTPLVPVVPSGKGGAAGGSQVKYFVDAAIAVCRGPITSIDRIWAEDLLLYDAGQNPPELYGDTIRIYLGDEVQTPDSLFQTIHGAGNLPAYRGLAYVVFDNLDCSRWGNRLPSMNFEVVNTQPYSTIILATANLELYYQFDTSPGQNHDSGPHGYNLSLVAGTETTIGGHANQGVALTGIDTLQAVVGSDPSFRADLNPDTFTIEGWFQFVGGTPSGAPCHVKLHNPSTGEIAWELIVQADLFSPKLAISGEIFTNTSGPSPFGTYETASRDTAWHYVALTFDVLGDAIFYFDGVAVESLSTGPVIAPATNLAITANAANYVSIDGGDINCDEVAFYNRVLTPAEIWVHYQGKGSTVGTILADVFNQCGLTPGQLDLIQATDVVEGFLIHTRQDARTTIQELLRLYDTDIVEYDGLLHAKKRGSPPVLTVLAADTGAHVTTGFETDPPKKVEVKRLPELEVPFRVDLRYYDRALDYQLGLQGATRFTKTEVQDPLTIQSTLVFYQDVARQKAEKELYRQWVERQQLTVSLGPAYLQLAAGDVIMLPVGATLVRSRIIGIDMGLLGPLTLTCVQDDASLLTQTTTGQPLTAATELVLATTTTLIAWNGNALVDTDATVVGLYAAAAPPDGEEWPGAVLYWSRDNGASYQQLATMSESATYGTANTALADFESGQPSGDVWDTVNTVDIDVLAGTPPASTSDADVLAGNNAALLGNEIVQFATVSPQGGSVYRLSRLLRGRRGTEQHEAEHLIGERFVLLGTKNLLRVNLTDDLHMRPVLLKCVTNGTHLAGATAVTCYLAGDELRCYSPVLLAASRDGSNNITYTWVRRTRIGGELTDGMDVPLSETTESYTVSILKGSPVTITGISQATAAVVTAPGHSITNGQLVYVSGVKGMPQINGLWAAAQSVVAGTSFALPLDSTGFDAYVSGGQAEVIVRQIAATSQTASYSAANQTTDGFTPGNPIRTLVQQNGLFGAGWPAFAVL